MKKSIIVFSLFIFILINIISAEAGGCYNFGVGSPYWPGNPLQLAPGQSNDFSMIIFNICDNDLLVWSLIIEGSEYVEITDESYLPEYNTTYFVPADSAVASHVRASIPSNANVGDIYSISFQFFSALPTNETPKFISNLIINFDILVIEPSKEICPSDLDNDEVVNETDFYMLLDNWGTSGPGDVNYDGIVNILDFLQLLGEWGSCPKGIDKGTIELLPYISTEAKEMIRKYDKGLYKEIMKEYRKELKSSSIKKAL